MSRNLLTLFLSIFFVSATPAPDSSNCESISVSVGIKELKNGEAKVTLKIRNAAKPMHVVFYRENGKLLNRDFESPTLILREKGTFYYAVVDANGCKIQSDFKVE